MAICAVLQHGAPELPYAIGDALEARGVTLDIRRVHDGEAVPGTADGLDGLVVMGGGMSAASDDGFATRLDELALLRDAVTRAIPTLGICLGAQLLAAAAGAAVYPGPAGLELGWTPVRLDAAASEDPLLAGEPACFSALSWHGDTFDLPITAVRLATGDVYQNQAFRVGDRAWGLQFHLEVDWPAVEAFVGAFPEEAARADGGGAGLLASTSAALGQIRPVRDRILGRFAALVAGGPPRAPR